MKKHLTTLCLISMAIILITGCMFESTTKRISRKLGVNLPKKMEVKEEKKPSFNGDGEFFAISKLTQEESSKIEKEIQANPKWKTTTLTGDTRILLYGGKKDGIDYQHNYAKERNIPTPENRYWFLLNKQNDTHTLETSAYSYNFIYAVYDKYSRTLYYLESDS